MKAEHFEGIYYTVYPGATQTGIGQCKLISRLGAPRSGNGLIEKKLGPELVYQVEIGISMRRNKGAVSGSSLTTFRLNEIVTKDLYLIHRIYYHDRLVATVSLYGTDRLLSTSISFFASIADSATSITASQTLLKPLNRDSGSKCGS